MAPAILAPAASIRPNPTAASTSTSNGRDSQSHNHHARDHPHKPPSSKRPSTSSSSSTTSESGSRFYDQPYSGPFPVFQPTDELLATYQKEFRVTRTILPLYKQPDVAPFLLGRLERNFRELMDNDTIQHMISIEAKCKSMQVYKDGDSWDDPHVVRIVADDEEAARLADQMVVHFLRHGDPRLPFNGFVVVPLHVLGAVIGLKGASIRPLQERLDVDVRSPPRDEAEGARSRALLIKGKAHNNVLSALKEIESAVERETKAAAAFGPSHSEGKRGAWGGATAGY